MRQPKVTVNRDQRQPETERKELVVEPVAELDVVVVAVLVAMKLVEAEELVEEDRDLRHQKMVTNATIKRKRREKMVLLLAKEEASAITPVTTVTIAVK